MEKDRNQSEIEITREMIEAGAEVVLTSYADLNQNRHWAESLAEDVLRAAFGMSPYPPSCSRG